VPSGGVGHDSTMSRIADIRSATRSTEPDDAVRIMLSTWEPPIGIEPMTYALRGIRDLPAYALAAPIARVIAWMALATLGLSGDPVHEPVHGSGLCLPPSSYRTWLRSGRRIGALRTGRPSWPDAGSSTFARLPGNASGKLLRPLARELVHVDVVAPRGDLAVAHLEGPHD
jgi:hypothetical protein